MRSDLKSKFLSRALLLPAPMEPVSEPQPSEGARDHRGRYRFDAQVDERGGVAWFTGVHLEPGGGVPVRIARERLVATESAGLSWPSIAWENDLRQRAQHLGLPRVLDRFQDADYAYLV